MTIYYSLTFMLLAAEMVTFCFLVAPLPHKIRKPIFQFLASSKAVGKIVYALKISFIFVGILFADAVQRMFRVTAESDLAKAGGQGAADLRTETNLAARKFYSQRNTYLTGFCLFLSLVLIRTFGIMTNLIKQEDEVARLQEQLKTKGGTAEQTKQIADLKKKVAALEAEERDFQTLRKQAGQQAAEFDRLATKYNEATGSVSNKRTD